MNDAEKAERAEMNALTTEMFARQPDMGCFCGSIDQAREAVAALRERDAHHDQERG